MKKSTPVFAVIFVLLFTGACAVHGQQASPLSLDSFIDLAKKNNPQMRTSAAAVSTNVAAWESSRSRLLPQVGGRADAGRTMSAGSAQSSGDVYGNSYSAGVSGQQLLFDFGKALFSTRAGSKLVEASRRDAATSLQTVVLNAKTAYFNYLLSRMLHAAAFEALSQARAHLQQAEILFETGKQAKYTVTAAEVDVANATVNVITAANGIKLARVQMEVASGVTLGDSLVLSDSLAAQEPEIPREQALAHAADSLPQLASLRAKLAAAKLQLASARAALFPSLSGSAGIGYGSRDDYASEWRQDWNVGVSLSAPVFQGGYLVAAVQSAKASVDLAQATLDAGLLSVRSAVDQDYYGKKEAAERITATEKLMQSAEESLRLAQERFATGAGTSLEVTDAELTLANAKSSHAQALYDYRTAHAKLLAAMGGM